MESAQSQMEEIESKPLRAIITKLLSERMFVNV